MNLIEKRRQEVLNFGCEVIAARHGTFIRGAIPSILSVGCEFEIWLEKQDDDFLICNLRRWTSYEAGIFDDTRVKVLTRVKEDVQRSVEKLWSEDTDPQTDIEDLTFQIMGEEIWNLFNRGSAA